MRTLAIIAHRLLKALSIAVVLTALPAAAASPVLGYDDARHLLARTGFGPTDAEVRAYATLTREAAVAKLLRDMRDERADPAARRPRRRSPVRLPRRETATRGRARGVRADAAAGGARAARLVGARKCW